MPVIVLCACLGVLIAAARIAFHRTASADTVGAVTFFVAFVSVLTALVIAVVKTGPPRRRSLMLTHQGFKVPHSLAANVWAFLLFPSAGGGVATVVNSWRDGDFDAGFWFWVGLLLATLPLLVLGIGMNVGGPALLFTPTGLIIRQRGLRRTIPWTALAPGSPRRPWGAGIELAVTRPEEITQFGIQFGNGSRAHPKVLAVNVDGQLLSGAIRWYVEHPDERPGIGTQAGLDALMANLRPLTAATR